MKKHTLTHTGINLDIGDQSSIESSVLSTTVKQYHNFDSLIENDKSI